MRHNALRDLEGNLMREVCPDVQSEQGHLQANQEELRTQTNYATKARLDIVKRGVLSQGENIILTSGWLIEQREEAGQNVHAK